MSKLPNGKIVLSDSKYISLVQQHISERATEILNVPAANEPGLSDSESEDEPVDDVANLDEQPEPSASEQNGTDPKPDGSKLEEFERDSSDDNESVMSEDDAVDEDESNERAKTLKDMGDELVQKGLWRDAIDCYTRALQCKRIASLYGNRCLCYMKLEEWDKAERDCGNAIELNPLYKRIFRRRAAIRLRRRDYLGCAADLQSLIVLSHSTQLDPSVMEEYRILHPLACLVRWEDVTSARVQKMEKDVLARLSAVEESAANSFRERSMWSQAVESLNMALILSPNSARLHYERAAANFKLGKALLAEPDCTKAIDLDPSNRSYYQLRADVRRKLGKISESRSDEKVAKTLPGDVDRLDGPPSASPAPPSPARSQPPDEPSTFIRVPVKDVYTSNRDELYDLSNLPHVIRVSIFS